MIRRVFLLVAVVLVAARVAQGPSGSTHWLSAMTLAVADVGLRWSAAAAWGVWALAVCVGVLALAAGAAPGWIWGPCSGGLLTGWLVTGRVARFKRERARCEQALREAEEREAALEKEQESQRTVLRERETAIQEMISMYQLSKQFLATLDEEEGLRITREFLGKTIPSLGEADLDQHTAAIRDLMRQGEVSTERLIQAIPLRGTSYTDRERWSILSNQLALGLQRISLYQQIQESATHDGLTGLIVRRHLRERLAGEVEGALRRGGSMVFLMVDLDRFKAVNDTYGHLVGDVVLREVARLIRASVREIDLVGRYGGEEFAVALPDADEQVGLHIAERIRTAVQNASIRAYDEEIHITVSVGLALFPRHAATAEQLVDQADRAMYCAKGLGRNRTVMAHA